ncbi:MAG: glycosyltransferase family 2 protein [Planctomycetota bacterium]
MTTLTESVPNAAVQPTPDSVSSSVDAEKILARLDDTLDLIAHANRVAAGTTPIDRVDVTVLIAVHNARHTLPTIMDRIDEVMPPATEVIIVDDGSDDGTPQYVHGRLRLERYESENESSSRHALRRTHLFKRRVSHGRGSALRLGIRHSRGHVIAIQDATLATDPADLLAGIWPILENQADAVYGIRKGGRPWVDRLATGIANWRGDAKLADLTHTQKVFRGDVLRSLSLSETGEGFDAEVTHKFVQQMTQHPSAVGTMLECPMPHSLDDAGQCETHRSSTSENRFAGQFECLRSAWLYR